MKKLALLNLRCKFKMAAWKTSVNGSETFIHAWQKGIKVGKEVAISFMDRPFGPSFSCPFSKMQFWAVWFALYNVIV